VGRLGQTLGYCIDTEGRFSWTGVSPITACDLLAAPDGVKQNAVDRAKLWLAELLKPGSREQKEISELAEAEGITRATLRRAKIALDVRSRRAAFGGSWFWWLPEDANVTAQ